MVQDEQFNAAIKEAQAAWSCNSTVGHKSWALKQLHGLYNLLMDVREELVHFAVTECQGSSLSVEKDFALAVNEIASHIERQKDRSRAGLGNCATSGNHETYYQPYGLSLILSNSHQTIRHAIIPFAASIASRNAVVLCSSTSSKLLALLRQKSPQYLDTSAIHVVAAAVQNIQVERFDQVLIIDDDYLRWCSSIQHPHVTCVPATEGPNVVTVDESETHLQKVAKDLLQHSPPNSPEADSIHVVFVHESRCENLLSEITKISTTSTDPITAIGAKNVKHLTSIFYHADLADLTPDLDETVSLFQKEKAVLLLNASSQDSMIDGIASLESVRTISVLSGSSKKDEIYMEDWTKSSVISFNCISTGLNFKTNITRGKNCGRGSALTASENIFQQQRLRIDSRTWVLGERDSVASIRRSYETMIQPLESEHPGGRMDFFVQVEYAFKAAALVVGAVGLVGMWIGSRAIRRRFL